MAALVTNIIHEVTFYASLAASTVSSVFHVITSLGKILFDAVCLIGSMLLTSLHCVYHSLTFVLAEFTLFICDTSSTLNEIWSMIGGAGQLAVDGIGGVLFFFKSCFLGICWALLSIFATMGDLSFFIVRVLKESVVLAGNGTLFLLQLVPLTLISLFSSLISAAQSTWESSHNMLVCAGNGAATFFYRIKQELIEIPPSSIFGLVLAFVLTALLRFILRSLDVHSKWDRFKSRIRNFEWPRVARARRQDPDDSMGSSPEPGPARSVGVESTYSPTNLLKQLEREREEKLCVICQDQVKCIILLPCRHFCLCNVCLETLAADYATCPICRREVLDHLRIYG